MPARVELAALRAPSPLTGRSHCASRHRYRPCKKGGGAEATEECYQKTPLAFATPTTEIRYIDGSRDPFLINATTTDQGTFPKGSQWRKNPIPMCNCDIGTGCATKGNEAAEAAAAAEAEALAAITGQGKTCKAVLREFCGEKTGYNTCLKCGTQSSYDCEECCPGLEMVHAAGGVSYCVDKSPKPCSKDEPRSCYNMPYPNSYLAPGQRVAECPTGLMFPSAWNEGAGAGIGGVFDFEMVDKLAVPAVEAGAWSLSWRWDCEQTCDPSIEHGRHRPPARGVRLTRARLSPRRPQVWNSCADITITA